MADIRRHQMRGRRRVCAALPTGAGKTVIAEAWLAPYAPERTLAVVHTDTLRQQTQRRLPGVRVETIQALTRRRRPLVGLDAAFLDECHHLASESWRALDRLLPASAAVLGCTAIPERADGAPLDDLFDALVAPVSYSELLRDGYLAPCDVVDLEGLQDDPARAYLEHGQGRPGILFAPTIDECKRAVSILAASGVRAVTIDSSLPSRTRAARVAAYDRGQLDLLASPMALAEGFDSPRAAVCVLARECVHVGTYLQIVNRVTRPHASKTAISPARVLDCTGAHKRHGHPLADRVYSLQGDPIAPARPPRQSGVVPARSRRSGSEVRAHATGVAIGSAVRTLWGAAVRAATWWTGWA